MSLQGDWTILKFNNRNLSIKIIIIICSVLDPGFFADPNPVLKTRMFYRKVLIYSKKSTNKNRHKSLKVKYRIFTINLLCLILIAH